MNHEFDEGVQGGKGFYIALMLCVAMIAVAAWMLVRDPAGEEPVQADTPVEVTPYYEVVVRAPADEPDPAEVIVQAEPVAEPAAEPVEEEPAQPVSVPVTEPAAAEYVWPVVGATAVGYSMDKLVYNVTMGDWRTHDGIDIAAEAGEIVRAAAAGTVEDVYVDDLYGTTVVISHGSGLYSYYAGLEAEPQVSAGSSVYVGDIIGAVGTTALCESAQTAHLHFAMSRDGMSVDPVGYLPGA